MAKKLPQTKFSGINQGGRAKGQAKAPAKKNLPIKPQARLTSQ